MVRTVTCPHCGKSKSSRHVAFCPKNPQRRKGRNIQENAAKVTPGEQPVIVGKVEAVPEPALPDFEPPEPEKSPQAPAASQGGPVPPLPSSVAVRPFVDLLCSTFNSRLNEVSTGKPATPQPPAPVSEEERQALSDVYGALADKYLPAVMQRWGIEVACVVTTVAVFGPRIWEWLDYRRHVKKELERKKQAEAPASGVGFNTGGGREEEERMREAYARAVQEGRTRV